MRVQSSAAMRAMPSVTPLAGELPFVVSLLNKYQSVLHQSERSTSNQVLSMVLIPYFRSSIVSHTGTVATVVQ